MKCWNSVFDAQGARLIIVVLSAFNAQGSRLIIVVLQVWAVKIYVAAVEALRKNKRGDETQFKSQLFHFVKFHPHLRIWRPIMQKLAVLAPLIAWLYR